MNNTDVKQMRAKLIAFVKSMGGQAGRTEMKEHLGLDPVRYYVHFDRAVKTKKLIPIHSMGEISPGLFLSRKPVVAYRLA
jgi:hypothetical protein